MCRKLFLSVLFAAAVCNTASAEPARTGSGRLADGRAYRVDQKGYRIIDELAELEVSVSELERQNAALEDESATKQKLIDQLKQGKCQQSAITESDLAAKKAESPLPPPAVVSCAGQTDPLKQRISDLEAKLAAQSDTIKVKESAARYGEQQTASIKDELDITRQQLALAPKAADLDSLRNKNSELEASVADLQSKLASAEQRSTTLASDLAEARQAATARAALASEKPAGTIPVEAQKTAAASSRMSAERGKTIGEQVGATEARREFKAELAKIDSKIGERKRLLDSIQGRKLGVTMTVQPLKTSDGRSLDSLRLAIGSNFDDSDIDAIRAGLAQINKILDDDLAVFHRLGRI